MTVAQRRAPRSFRASLPDPAHWLWRKLTSVRWAIGLILLAALASGAGVVIPQVPPQFTAVPEQVEAHVEAQRGTWGWATDLLADFPWFYETNGGIFNLFNQPYWFALVGLVAVAISVCTVSRAPPIWRTVRRPPKRVNAAYFERARHRFAADLPAGSDPAAAADALAGALAGRRFRVSRIAAAESERSGQSERSERSEPGPLLLFADRYGWAQLATFATHIALLLLLGATLITKFAGEEYQFWVAEGESRPLFAAGDDRPQVQVIVDDAVARFADDGQALEFRSDVRVSLGGEEVAAGQVTVNGPLHAAGYRVHQASYWEHGAELRAFDAETGQLVYSETHFLDQQLVGPRVRVGRGAAVFSEEVVPLRHQAAPEPGADEARAARIAAAGYSAIPLFEDRSLALALVPAAGEGPQPLEFWYRIIDGPADADFSGLSLDDLGVGAEPPTAPDIRLADGGGAARLDGPVPLVRLIEGEGARIADLSADGIPLIVGLRGEDSGASFFYFAPDDPSARGELEPGAAVDLPGLGLRLEYRGTVADASRQGSLAPGETRRVGAIELSFLGAESVFYSLVDDLPGAAGESVLALERFGEARTAETFDARGGESVRLAVNTAGTSAGGQAGRPARLALGLPDGGRLDLDEGGSGTVGGYRYEFRGAREFTGLNLRRDPGAVAFWIAVGLGIAGMSATFFLPRRRVWVRVAEGRAMLAGQAGHGVPLQRELRAVCAEAGLAYDEAPAPAPRRRGRFAADYERPDPDQGR